MFEICIQNGTYYFNVIIDGVRKVHIQNNIARQFTNVEIYAGDAYHEAADGEIKNFHARQLSKTGKVRL